MSCGGVAQCVAYLLFLEVMPRKKGYEQLRRECRLAGVSTQGKKTAMLKRLRCLRRAPGLALSHRELTRRARDAGLHRGRDQRSEVELVHMLRATSPVSLRAASEISFVDYYCGMGGASLRRSRLDTSYLVVSILTMQHALAFLTITVPRLLRLI